MNCGICGEKNNNITKYCKKCGAKFKNNDIFNIDHQENTNNELKIVDIIKAKFDTNKKVITISLAIILLILMVFSFNSKTAYQYVQQANQEYENGNYEKALISVQRALRKEKSLIEAYLTKADILMATKQHNSAQSIMLQSIANFPTEERLYLKLIELNENIGIKIEDTKKQLLAQNIEIPEEISKKVFSTKQENVAIYVARTVQDTKIRNLPSLYNSQVLHVARKGERVMVVQGEFVTEVDSDGRSRDWLKVKLDDGQTGWISDRALDGTNLP